MQRSHKRGVAAIEFLGVILLILIGGFVVIGTIKVFYSKAEGTQAEALCRSSVEMRAKTLLGLEWQGIIEHKIALVPLLCKTQDKEISGTAEQVMKELAKLMARCKWMFADGKYMSILKNPGRTTREFCFPCYTVIINEIKDAPYISAETFKGFLLTNHYKGDITYYEYLTNFEGAPAYYLPPNKIERGHIYQIHYADINSGRIQSILGIVFKKGEFSSGIYMVDPNKPPETYTLDYWWDVFGVFEEGKTCKVIEDLQGS